MIRTELCDLLDIKYPVIQGGMAGVSTAELAAAVSEAGGLGIIGSGTANDSWVQEQVRLTRQFTKKPFGVNVLLLSPYVEGIIKVIIKEQVPVITTGAGNPGKYLPALQKAGVKVIPVVSSVFLAKRLVRNGVNAIIAEGMESGGHIGELGTMAIVPQVVEAVDVPVIAAGGIYDGRGLAAALCLGAMGVQMGTRFMCASECTIHPNVKKMIIKAKDRDTVVTGGAIGHPVRVLRNKLTRQYEELEGRCAPPEEIEKLGVGRLRAAMVDGDVEYGSIMSGQVSAMVREVQAAREIIADVVQGAAEILQNLSYRMVEQK
ncbi:MAG TPA: enoyl-[acyl-carrier-protein] reductase FabK [Desulfotomaculum sp.]|nr:enoyl-[acyl-carrier-protein] reductase FabK [Desulfotomaculum sp.]